MPAKAVLGCLRPSLMTQGEGLSYPLGGRGGYASEPAFKSRVKMMKEQIELDVRTTTQCSFIPFTAVPDSWKGRKVRIELVEEEAPAVLTLASDELPWPT